jgi:hypothetical protein
MFGVRASKLGLRGQSVKSPAITWWQKDHPLFKDIEPGLLQLREAISLAQATGAEPLLASPKGVLMAFLPIQGKNILWCGASLAESNLPALPSFPLLLRNYLRYLSEPVQRTGMNRESQIQQARISGLFDEEESRQAAISSPTPSSLVPPPAETVAPRRRYLAQPALGVAVCFLLLCWFLDSGRKKTGAD